MNEQEQYSYYDYDPDADDSPNMKGPMPPGTPVVLYECCGVWNIIRDGFDEVTEVMNVPGGCVMRTTIQHGDNISTSICYVPTVQIALNAAGEPELTPIFISKG